MNSFELSENQLKKFTDKLQSRLKYYGKVSEKFSKYRLFIFLIGLAVTISAFYADKAAGWLILVLSTAVFSVTVHLHNVLLAKMKKFNLFIKIKNSHLARMKFDWNDFPAAGNPVLPPENSLARDLDILGEKSLHRLIDVSVSEEGSKLIADVLTDTEPDPDSIIEIQKLVKEIYMLPSFIDKILMKAELFSSKKINCERLKAFFETAADKPLPSWVFPLNFLFILTYLTLFMLSLFDVTGSIWIAIFIIYFFVYSLNAKKISKVFSEAADIEHQLKKYSSIVFFVNSRLETLKRSSPELHDFLHYSIGTSAKKLQELRKYVNLIVIRENQLVRLLLNVLFPYDVFVFSKFIRISSVIKENIPIWLNHFNRLELFLSLGNFARLNPDFTFPEIVKNQEGVFHAFELGHPLIERDLKICNDFSLKKENEIVLITGSNMSGKSTFIKTIGINLCLAYSGAPVNADKMTLSVFELFTCIKISDSVSDGISYFYAEVKKLKQLLDELKTAGRREIFYLIDEIFKGTNNRERLEGSREFIKTISGLNGTGFITTHDLELVNLASEIHTICNYHFREEIVDSRMEFDYKIHEGPCPTTNALKIMKMEGLI